MGIAEGTVANLAASYIVNQYSPANSELKVAAGTGALLGGYAYMKEPGLPPVQVALLGAGLSYVGQMYVAPMILARM